jgi:hypothetical protein
MLKVGDVVRMWEDGPYALASTVLTGYERQDATNVVSGVPSFGFETVDFLANDGRYKVLRRAS